LVFVLVTVLSFTSLVCVIECEAQSSAARPSIGLSTVRVIVVSPAGLSTVLVVVTSSARAKVAPPIANAAEIAKIAAVCLVFITSSKETAEPGENASPGTGPVVAPRRGRRCTTTPAMRKGFVRRGAAGQFSARETAAELLEAAQLWR
jgi:hypothetical protein